MVTELDPVNATVALLTYLLGSAAAAIIGPYAVILVASTVGASWSLGRRDRSANASAVAYFLRINATAALVTVALANLTAKWLGQEDPILLISGTALIIGIVGDDWPKLVSWAVRKVMRRAVMKVGNGENE